MLSWQGHVGANVWPRGVAAPAPVGATIPATTTSIANHARRTIPPLAPVGDDPNAVELLLEGPLARRIQPDRTLDSIRLPTMLECRSTEAKCEALNSSNSTAMPIRAGRSSRLGVIRGSRSAS